MDHFEKPWSSPIIGLICFVTIIFIALKTLTLKVLCIYFSSVIGHSVELGYLSQLLAKQATVKPATYNL